MSPVPGIMLNNGQTIPQLGFGVFLIEPQDTAEAVAAALEAGYRHIDTAEMYGNEREVGEAIGKSGIDRASVFVTSKLSNGCHRQEDARRAFDQTLEALGFDYIDLFLIHWPLPMRYDGDFVSTWHTLGEFYREGRARSIGVSNFQPDHLRRLYAQSDIPPAVNQIEVSPYLTQTDLRRFCAEHQDRQGYRQDPRPGRPALAHPARRHRVPEVGQARQDQGELRRLRLRAHR